MRPSVRRRDGDRIMPRDEPDLIPAEGGTGPRSDDTRPVRWQRDGAPTHTTRRPTKMTEMTLPAPGLAGAGPAGRARGAR